MCLPYLKLSDPLHFFLFGLCIQVHAVTNKYLHFCCEFLNEPVLLRCRSYMHFHEQIDLKVTPTYTAFGRTTLNTYRHDIKRGNLVYLAIPKPYVRFNSKYLKTTQVTCRVKIEN